MRLLRTAQLQEKLSLLGGLECLLQVSLTVRYKMYQFFTNITIVFANISQKSFEKFMTEFSYNISMKVLYTYIYIYLITYLLAYLHTYVHIQA